MKRIRREKQGRPGKSCAICGGPATNIGEYEPSVEERERWGFSPLPCGLCSECEKLPDVGGRLSVALGFSAQLGRVQ